MKIISCFIVASLLALTTQSAQAVEATVLKAKGRQAIIQFSSDAVPRAGSKIEVGPPTEGISTAALDREVGGKRSNLVGISATVSSLSTASTSSSGTTTTGSTNLSLSGQYGWNFETFELGPLVSFSYTGNKGSSTTSFLGGGFLDYDILPNLQSAKIVAGLGAQLLGGSSSQSGGSSSSAFQVLSGGQLKWFCFGHQTALRLDALGDYRRASGTVTTTETGFVLKAGLQYYF